jgi:hypothetical protein
LFLFVNVNKIKFRKGADFNIALTQKRRKQSDADLGALAQEVLIRGEHGGDDAADIFLHLLRRAADVFYRVEYAVKLAVGEPEGRIGLDA